MSKKQIIQLAKRYTTQVERRKIDDGFCEEHMTIRDTQRQGASFKVSFGYKDEIVAIDFTDSPFTLGRLNVAEGYNDKEMTKIANDILEGIFDTRITLTGKIQLGFLINETERVWTNKVRQGDAAVPRAYGRI